MACSNRPGPAAYRAYIETMCGQKISQQEWHDLRQIAEIDGYGVSRSRVTPEEALYAAASVGGQMRMEFGNNPETKDEQNEAFDGLAAKLNGTNVTEATANIVRYLSDNGVRDSLALARQYRKNGGSMFPPVNGGTNDGWDDERAAVAAEVEVERDDEKAERQRKCSRCGGPATVYAGGGGSGDWADYYCDNDVPAGFAVWDRLADTEDPYADDNKAESDLADSERQWSERVAYFESLGMTTSDAQGAADAEAIIRDKAKQGPYGTARVGSKFTGYRDASAISKDVRTDIKDAVKAGDLPSDLSTSVKTDKYAGGQAVNVGLTGWEPERVWRQESDQYGPRWVYTPEAKAVADRVEALRGAYNRDASDSQMDYFDVTYYGNTQWNVPTQ